jgi:hypothetical protein
LSVSTRLPIVAIVATIVFVPVLDKAHHLLGHMIQRGPSYTITCTPGEPIPSTELTEKIHIAGRPCRAHPGGRFRIEPRGQVCPKNLWWRDGQCVVVHRQLASQHP